MMRWISGFMLALLLSMSAVVMSEAGILPERFSINAPIMNSLFGWDADAPAESELETRLQVPDGFTLNRYAVGVSNARELLATPAGDLLVSAPRRNRIMLLSADKDGDGRADVKRVLIDGLDGPHGIDLHEGYLYIAERSAVGRIAFDAASGEVSGDYRHIVTGLPDGGNHWTRTVRVGPDDRLYVSVGSSCNVCIEDDPRRAAILRYTLDGGEGEIFARGLRNSVGMDWRPADGALYAVDNGRDLLGDDFPPEEMNKVVAGGHYGWPFFHGDNVPDPEFGTHPQVAQIRDTLRGQAYGFTAHMAPLGITFMRNPDAPGGLAGAALVAFHGSWNRSRKSGYKVMSVHWGADGTISTRDFLWGFEKDEDVIGRPVSVAEGVDGAIYVSDDYTGTIYRVVWGGEGKQVMRPAAAPPAAAGMAMRDPLAGLSDAERMQLTQRGGEIYAAMGCVNCHGPQGEGRTAPALAGLAQRYGIADLVALFEKPPANMPPARLNGDEARALAVRLLDVNG